MTARTPWYALAVLTGLVLGCSAPSRTGYTYDLTYHPYGKDCPADVAFDTLDQPFTVSEIESLGNRIFRHDAAIRDASRELDRLPNAARRAIEERISVDFDGGIRVRFIDADAHSVLDVFVSGSGVPSSVEVHDPPIAISREEFWQHRAKRLAAVQSFRACTPAYHVVAIPEQRDHAPVWLVYLLAQVADEKAWVMGGHHRLWINQEGTAILERQALSRGCPIWAIDPTSTGDSISNFGVRLPLETHVYTSLLYGREFRVFNEDHAWLVSSGHIQLVPDDPPKSP